MRKLSTLLILFAALLLVGCSGENATAVSDDGQNQIIQLGKKDLTIDKEGSYILRGELENGSIIIDAEKESKITLVLDGVSVHSRDFAAIYVKQADKLVINLAEGSENELSNGGSFKQRDENNVDGAIFSKDDLTIKGNGSLKIISTADHGIVCKDSLKIKGGEIEIQAAGHGISCKEDVDISAARLTISSQKDGIQADNSDDAALGKINVQSGSIKIEAQGDGISASGELRIEDGLFNILTGGGSVNAPERSSDFFGGFGGRGPRPDAKNEDENTVSTKALKAAGNIEILSGEFFIDALDDAVHSNGSITIKGGKFDVLTGDDGMHADESLVVSGGSIAINKSYEGLEALHIAIEGGEIVIDANDDGLNAAGGTDQSGMGHGDRFGPPGMSMNSDGSIVVSGGKLYIKAKGDGIDANGTLEITGGDTVVCTPTQGDTATLDFDVSGTISGGSFFGSGANSMLAQTFGDSPQGILAFGVGSMPAGTEVKVFDSMGNLVISHTPELEFAVVILSTKDLEKGENYMVTIAELSGEIPAY